MNNQQDELDRLGYTVLPEVIPSTFLSALNQRIDELFQIEGAAAGSEFKQEQGCRRLANLINKGSVFADAVSLPAILSLVKHVLGEVKLSSLNVRSVNPVDPNQNGEPRQPLHADMGAIRDERGYWVCNVLWMLHDIHIDNGPLRVIPGTHRRGTLPQESLSDPVAHHPDEVLVTGPAGTIVVMNAHLWHGGMENRSDRPRRAMHAFYCRRDKPQQQYQKRLLDAEVQRSLSPQLRNLLAIDDPENDRLSSQVTVTSGFMK